MKLTKRYRKRGGKKYTIKKNNKKRTKKRIHRKRSRKAGDSDMEPESEDMDEPKTNEFSESDFTDFVANDGGGIRSKKGGEFGEGDNPNDRDKRM